MSLTCYYTLDGRTPVACDDPGTWGEWFSRADRHVADTTGADGVRVSTVFLGIDHGIDHGPPVLFETQVFGGAFDGEMERYRTWDEAEAGHRAMCTRVFGSCQR